jgi:transglutaminase-like putative cysteine protease
LSIRIALHHRTEYSFDRPVRLSPHVVRLRPAPHCRTRITSYSLVVEPRDHFLNWQQDPQGNHVARLVFPEPTRRLVLEVDLVAELVAINAFDFFLEPEAERFPFAYDPVLAAELSPYLATPAETGGPAVEGFLAEFRRGGAAVAGGRSIDLLVALNRAVHDAVAYVIRLEPGVQSPGETLGLGTGSCRDSAWLFVSLARRLGLAARFCSGYLVQLVPDQRPLDGPAGPAADFTDLHAWAEVYLPGAGWVGFDPTSGLLAAEGHIPLAATPDPASAAPVTGAVDPCQTEFAFEMRLTRLAESPRTTRPFTEPQWERILAVGDEVDAALAAGDVRLTMGGEPTFVSLDDGDAPEWNTAALGADKRRRAGVLVRRLLDRLAPGGVLLEGQGKWYPGEPLPRWTLDLVWRNDGQPIWSRRPLLADDSPVAARREADHGPAGTVAGASERVGQAAAAGDFARSLARRLGLDPGFVIPAHEVAPSSPLDRVAIDTETPAAFVLPILQNMSAPMIVDGKKAHPTALVVTPTRELCGQIEEVGETLATYSGRRVVAVFGGVPYDPQAKRIRKGVDLLVATPGRLLDMLRQGDVLLDKVDTLVLDEADRMLDMGFWPDVKRIIDAIPSQRQNLFFSATMTKTVLSIISDTLHDPVFIELGGTAQPVDNVEQKVLPVNHEQKVDLLVEYFRHHDPERTLVFTRTRRRAERLARTLNKAGITCEAIHGDRTQGQRQQALDGFKSGKIAVLVATDVVARGIDVDNITHVINFDIPTNPEDYVHRIGRTARAGASGIAVSMVTAEDVHDLVAIERLIGATLERHDLPEFDYDKRVILESSQVRPRPGKLLWNGGAHRSWNKTGVKRRVPGKRSR